MTKKQIVTVYGASGHTGRFVVAELLARGYSVRLAGRNAAKLASLGSRYPEAEIRTASVDDPVQLDAALAGSAAVINCAGPFLETATPVIEAALRSGVHYLDVTAEQQSARAAFENFDEAAREKGIVIIPAASFYGGLGDLLAAAAMADWSEADEIIIATALNSWHPTAGTRITGERNTARRLIFSNNALEYLADPPPKRSWDFAGEFGREEMIALPMSEIITISSHLRAREIHSFINLAPLADLRNRETPAPVATDASGRSAQKFRMEALARCGNQQRRAVAAGRDIYALTAPIVVEALERILENRLTRTGVAAVGEIFDARDFLESLSPAHLFFEIS